MAHFSTLRDYRFTDAAAGDDVRGAKLYGRDDEKLGTIEDVIFDHQSGDVRYAIVDTGGWLSSKHFLVPAVRIEPRADRDGMAKDDEFRVSATKKEIEAFPAYDEEHLRDEKRWAEYEDKYRARARDIGWSEDGDVLHQAGTARIITPDPATVSSNAPHIAAGDHVEGLHPRPLQHREVGMMDTTPTAVGQRPEYDRLSVTRSETADLNRNEVPDQRSSDLDSKRRADSAPDMPSGSAELSGGAAMMDNDVKRGRDMAGNTPTAANIGACTMEGDAIFNSEDVRHSRGKAVEDRDVPAYSRPRPIAEDTGTPNMQGRWSRFGTRVREHLEGIRGECSVCNAMQNRHREDAA